MKNQMFVTLLIASLQIGTSYSHVALTYPIARRVDYDFLDNVRTPGPCGGQPKGKFMYITCVMVLLSTLREFS